jgi:cytochrome c-type biogenesis protein CcmE
MNTRKKRRLAFAVAVIAAAAAGAFAVIGLLNNNILYFYSPSEIVQNHVGPGTPFRIGGLVEKDSIRHGKGADVQFIITDGRRSVPVVFEGVLPALFRGGQGVVASGSLTNAGVFDATEVLAKHDARYMPPNVVDALKKSGRWKEGGS